MAGQAGMALHTMAILQSYQADVLKEMDEGTGLTPEAVKELRRATDLALRATKHTARAVGRSMAASSQVCLPLHDTLIPLSHFLHEWERLPGVSLWVLRTIRAGYTLQFGKNRTRFDGVHLTVVNSASKASVLQQELSSLLQKGAIEEVPQSEVERGFFSRYFLVPKRDGGLSTAFEFFPLQREVQDADDKNHHVSGPGRGLVCHHRPESCVFSHPGRSKTQEVPSVCLWREGLPIQGPPLRPGFGAENVYKMHGCCTGPFEAPGRSCTELSGRQAHSGSLQGVCESSQGYRSRPHPFSWPQDERQ